MHKHVFLYLACILAGFALTLIKPVSFITYGIIILLKVIGVITVIVFSIALLIIGLKALLGKPW